MKKDLRIHEFNPVIYPVKLWITRSADMEFIDENFMSKDRGRVLGPANNNFVAHTSDIVIHKESGMYGCLIILPSRENVGILAHEATHAARIIWDWLGENCTGSEADAYLVQWIVNCLDIINKLK